MSSEGKKVYSANQMAVNKRRRHLVTQPHPFPMTSVNCKAMELAKQKQVLPLGGKKKRENRKTKAAQSPMSCGRWERRAKALSCKCNHVSLAVHYVCSSEQCDGARKTATPAWISFGNCERPSAARRPATTTEKARGKSKNRGKCTDTRIQIQIQKGVRTRN